MPHLLQATYSRGEISRELNTRVDLELFRSGLAECTNFVTLKRGGFRRRGGTRFVGETKEGFFTSRFIRFQFSTEQSYMLEFANFYFRVYTSAGRVGTVEVATPYPQHEIGDIKFVQSVDALFLTHPNHAPRKIERFSDTNWTLSQLDFKDGPYLPVNETTTTLTPSATGNPVPLMTSNTLPEGVVAETGSAADAYRVFDQSPSTYFYKTNEAAWISYQFASGSRVVDAYWIQATSEPENAARAPVNWKFQGWNGASWVTLDSRTGETGWVGGERRYFEFINEAAFSRYRLEWTATGADDASQIAQLVLHERAENQSPIALTASSSAGINNGQGFLSTDTGRMVRFLGTDSRWRWARIVAYVSPTAVTVRFYGHALPDTDATTSWALGSWSPETGYPAAIGFYKSRLAFASTPSEPQKVWESQSEDFTNFSISSPLEASDAVSLELLSGKVNAVQWLSEDTDLVAGTAAAVRRIGKAVSNQVFGPENVEQTVATNFGSNGAQPASIGSTLLYWGRFGTDLREQIYDFDVNGYVSRSLSEISHHLYQTPIVAGAYQQYPSSILWQWNTAGAWIGFTYEREQQVFGFHRHTTRNDSVEWIDAISTAGADETWMIVKRLINGQTKRYIEILQPPFDGGAIEDAWHLDCAVKYEGAAANSVSGLAHLEGEEVVMYANGANYTTTVTGASASLPAGVTATPILIGFDVEARAKTLPPPANTQDGSSVGREMLVTDAYIAVYETGSLRVGSDETYRDEIITYRDNDLDNEPAPLKTGMLRVPVDMRWEEHGQLVFEASGGKPATVLSTNYQVKMAP